MRVAAVKDTRTISRVGSPAVMVLRRRQLYPLLLCVINSNVNTTRKEIMAQYPYENSFDLTNPLKGF